MRFEGIRKVVIRAEIKDENYRQKASVVLDIKKLEAMMKKIESSKERQESKVMTPY
jgi:hypothetical protein